MISGIRRWMGGMARPRMGRRIAALCLSVTAMGLCVAVFDRIGLGTDPCSTMNLGLSRKIGLPFGTTQLLVNLLMLIAVLRYDIGRIGMGTIANMVFVGYIADKSLPYAVCVVVEDIDDGLGGGSVCAPIAAGVFRYLDEHRERVASPITGD